MDVPSHYWTFVYLNAAGQLRLKDYADAKAWFEQHCSDLIEQAQIPHSVIQHRLTQARLALPASIAPTARHQTSSTDSPNTISLHPAEACLRCFISHQISYACQQLDEQFGTIHGFNRFDLLPLVLNDDRLLSRHSPSSYRSLATEILDTFDPQRSHLKTWAIRLVRHHKELNRVLLEHGIYLVSDWAILNDTELPQLDRILAEFHHLSTFEIQQASTLLESYHAIYRSDRLHQNQSGGRCLIPNQTQLQRMAAYLQAEYDLTRSPQQLLQDLQTLADQLRRYRIAVRSKVLPTDSLDIPDQQLMVETLPTPRQEPSDDDGMQDFLSHYRQQFIQSLDEALTHVVDQRVTFFQRRKGNRAHLFLKGLQLFHCIGQTMAVIAPQIGYQRQDQVAYLLKLRQLRADVRHHLLTQLRDRIQSLAASFTNPTQLQTLDQRVDDALTEQVDDLIRQTETEASVAREGPLKSLFARRLCQYLDTQL